MAEIRVGHIESKVNTMISFCLDRCHVFYKLKQIKFITKSHDNEINWNSERKEVDQIKPG